MLAKSWTMRSYTSTCKVTQEPPECKVTRGIMCEVTRSPDVLSQGARARHELAIRVLSQSTFIRFPQMRLSNSNVRQQRDHLFVGEIRF